MKQKKFIFTLDLEADHAGLIRANYQMWKKENVLVVLNLLKKHQVPLSVFVVAQTLNKKNQEIIKLFQKFGAEFHLHSYSHHQLQKDFQEELSLGINAFVDFFGYKPLAYRAPAYQITLRDLAILKQHDIKLDSSCLPSLWQMPKHFFQKASFIKNKHVKELLVTVLNPFGIPNALSWMKLLGFKFFIFCFKLHVRLSNRQRPTVFVFHLHDLFVSKSHKNLNCFWRFIYSRNKTLGLQYLEDFIIYLKKEKFEFDQVSNYL
jgi:peptidoglycan/xylan/chitin deacetylase (PgdA/CDA1 family)